MHHPEDHPMSMVRRSSRRGGRLTATFAEHHRGTRLTMRMLFETADECSRVKRFAVEANEQNLDRLEAELARMA